MIIISPEFSLDSCLCTVVRLTHYLKEMRYGRRPQWVEIQFGSIKFRGKQIFFVVYIKNKKSRENNYLNLIFPFLYMLLSLIGNNCR
jgi:hypothetical protein